MQNSVCLRIDILWVCLAILRRAYLFGERIFLGVLYQGKSVAFTSDHSSLSRGWESMTANGPTRTKVSWLLSCYPNTYDVSASAPLGGVGNPYDMKMRETVKGCYRLCAGRRYNLHNCKSDGWVSEYEYIYIYIYIYIKAIVVDGGVNWVPFASMCGRWRCLVIFVFFIWLIMGYAKVVVQMLRCWKRSFHFLLSNDSLFFW